MVIAMHKKKGENELTAVASLSSASLEKRLPTALKKTCREIIIYYIIKYDYFII